MSRVLFHSGSPFDLSKSNATCARKLDHFATSLRIARALSLSLDHPASARSFDAIKKCASRCQDETKRGKRALELRCRASDIVRIGRTSPREGTDFAVNDIPPIPVCAIGASAGGIEALQQFFGALPTDLGLAYAVVLGDLLRSQGQDVRVVHSGDDAIVAVTGFGHNYQAASGSVFEHRLLKPVTADRAAELLNSLA
jgi:CheB methylesterase